MFVSAVQVAKRALLATMHAAAVMFGLTMSCKRDSPDKDVVTIFRKLALRAQPDQPGGGTEQQQRLNYARAFFSKQFDGHTRETPPANQS